MRFQNYEKAFQVRLYRQLFVEINLIVFLKLQFLIGKNGL